ncbi:putative DNA-binding transcriptional regulator [Escherichia coli]|uniref:Putative DNA-binding transcriptional regulator n=1 Tax=Escherichia coli TaxID=562 RepID=A0A376Y668_ECOLX|nr:putative DNA-binding transcriptional regulator [Escherichia coli]
MSLLADYEHLCAARNPGMSVQASTLPLLLKIWLPKRWSFTIEEVNADRNVSNKRQNRQIVLNLYEKGIFDIKDAINQVADRLNISKHTVYLYIRQFKSGDFQGQDK